MAIRIITSVVTLALAAIPVAAGDDAVRKTNAEAVRANGLLDLVPSDATAAVVLRDVDDLRKKGDRFIEKTEMKAGLRPSDILNQLFPWLGVRSGLDRHAPTAVLLVNLKAAGVDELGLDNIQKALLVAVPFDDLEEMAENFDLAVADLKAGRIVKGKNKTEPFKPVGYFQVRGRHLLMASHKKAVEAATGAKPVSASLSGNERAALNRSDILIHLGTTAWGAGWESAVQRIEERVQQHNDSPEGRIARQLGKTVRALRFGVIGVRLDEGLGLTAVSVFSEDGAAETILTRLAGDASASDLAALPQRSSLLAAYAARRDSSQNAVLAGALLEWLLANVSETKQLVSAARRPEFIGVFGEVWQRLDGSRVGVYLNPNESKHGLLSIAAVLDTPDSEKFLADTRELATFINNAGQKLTEASGDGIDEKTIQTLIEQLGADDFRARRTATVKLNVLGEPALPYLEKAASSKDAEVAARARRLQKRIAAAAAARRKDLLGRDLLSRLEPKFVYFPGVEHLSGTSVDVINVRLSEKDEPFRRHLKQLFGPQWDRLRVATHGRQIVVLLGSDVNVLQQTLANLKQNEAGLASAAALGEFRKRADGKRKAQFHLSLARALRLVTPPGSKRPPEPAAGEGVSSLSLSVAPTRIRLDAFLPFGEAKVIFKDQRW